MNYHTLFDFYKNTRISNKTINHKTTIPIPDSIQDAYRIQSEIIKALPKLGGWKIGGSSYETQKIFNTNEIYFGPIFLLP